MLDKELIKGNKDTNQVIEDLLIEYKPLVKTYARRYFLIGGEMDDLVQEGMIGLYKAIENYDSTKQASFKTFAILCITRQMQSLIRKFQSKKNVYFANLVDSELMECFDIPSNRENPESKIISLEKMEYINSEIEDKLSKLEKRILDLYLKGYSYEQIANELEIQKKSVDNALNRIRNKLSHLLNNTEY